MVYFPRLCFHRRHLFSSSSCRFSLWLRSGGGVAQGRKCAVAVAHLHCGAHRRSPLICHALRGWRTTVGMTLLERGAINKSVVQPHNLSLHGNLMVRSVGRNRSEEGKDAISITTAAPYLER